MPTSFQPTCILNAAQMSAQLLLIYTCAATYFYGRGIPASMGALQPVGNRFSISFIFPPDHFCALIVKEKYVLEPNNASF